MKRKWIIVNSVILIAILLSVFYGVNKARSLADPDIEKSIEQKSKPKDLNEAIKQNDYNAVKAFIDGGADIMEGDTTKSREYAVSLAKAEERRAIESGETFISKKMAKGDYNYNVEELERDKALIKIAVESAYEKTLEKYTPTSSGNTPLHLAAKYSASYEIINALVQAGANLECENAGDFTPLELAIENLSDVDTVHGFIKAGANTSSKSKYDTLLIFDCLQKLNLYNSDLTPQEEKDARSKIAKYIILVASANKKNNISISNISESWEDLYSSAYMGVYSYCDYENIEAVLDALAEFGFTPLYGYETGSEPVYTPIYNFLLHSPSDIRDLNKAKLIRILEYIIDKSGNSCKELNHLKAIKSPFSLKVVKDNPELIPVLIKAGYDINAEEAITVIKPNEEPLNLDYYKMCVYCGYDVSSRAAYYLMAQAANYGEVELVKLLISLGADINYPITEDYRDILDFCLPLYDINSKPDYIDRKLEIFKLLISLGADIKRKDSDGEDIAFRTRKLDDKRFFKAVISASNEHKQSIELINEINKGASVDILKKLIDSGANPNYKGFCTPFKFEYVNHGSLSVLTDVKKASPLTFALLRSNNDSTIQLLLDKGATVQRNILGYFCSAYEENNHGQLPTIKKVLELGCKINDPITIINKSIFKSEIVCVSNPLSIAMVRGIDDTKLYSLFIESLDDINDDNYFDGETFLSMSITHNLNKLTYFLIKNGADINHIHKSKLTPIFYAIDSKNTEICQFLIKKGCNVNAEYPTTLMNGEDALLTPLINTIFQVGSRGFSNSDILIICEELLKAGADVNHKCGYVSPIYWVIAGDLKNKDLVDLLIKYNADVNRKSPPNNSTPLLFACEHSSYSIVKALIEAGADVKAETKDGETTLIRAEKNKTTDKAKIMVELVKSGIDSGN